MLPINPARIPEIMRRAKAAEAAGRTEEAERLYRSVVAARPAEAGAWFALAALAARRGDRAAAEEALEKAVAHRPDQPTIWQAMIRLALGAGDRARAEAVLARAKTAVDPKAAAALAAMIAPRGETSAPSPAEGAPEGAVRKVLALAGRREFDAARAEAAALARRYPAAALFPLVEATAAAELGRHEAAERAFDEALRRLPDYAEAHARLGEYLLARGRRDEARRHLERARQLSPSAPGPLLALARLEHAAGRDDEAWARLDEAAKKGARGPEFELLRGLVAARLRRDSAVRHLRRAVAAGAGGAEARLELARALDRRGDTDAALAELAALERDAPGAAAVNAARAQILMSLGRFDEALDELRVGMDKEPEMGSLYYSYATARKIGADDPMIERMAELFEAGTMPDLERVSLGYALAKAMEDTGQHDRVFRYLDAANATLARLFPYDYEADRAEAERVRRNFTPALRRRYADAGAPEPRPIFVTGLPRSGTTLVEQILSSHSTVAAGGEVGKLSPVMRDLVATLDAAGERPVDIDFANIGRTYWTYLQERHPDAPRITDKSIATYNHIGYVKLAMPNARIIVVRRDPRDNALSIYKNFFQPGLHRYSTDLRAIARFQKLFDRQVAFWREVWPDAFHEVHYEALVADPEGEVRKLLAAADLEWEDACLNFHQNRRRVDTLSVRQVRQPLYASSVGAWTRFEKDLAPFLEELARPAE